jgi:hypothetical protein
VRPMFEADAEAVNRLYAESQFAFDWPKWPSKEYESVLLAVDKQDSPLMLCAAVKRVELYLLARNCDPFTKLEALTLIDRAMRDEMAAKGITKGYAFLQPSVELPFGRRLQRDFGWDMRRDPVYIVRGG